MYYCCFVLCGLLAGGCAGGGAHLKQENSTLQQTVGRLRAEARQDRHRIRDLENQVFLLEDRAETAEIEEGRTAGMQPDLPVEVLEPEGTETTAVPEYRVAGVDDDGTEIIYVGEAAEEGSVRPDAGGMAEEARRRPARSGPVRTAANATPESSERIAVTSDVPTIDNQMKKTGVERPAIRSPKRSSPERKDPREQYNAHYAALRAGKHAEAIAGFGMFLARYPKHDYADNAQYWLGEAYYDQNDYRGALTEFRKVVAEYPKGNKVPDALLKLGYSYLALGRPGDARDVLEQVVRIYPRSNPAALAAQKLASMPAD